MGSVFNMYKLFKTDRYYLIRNYLRIIAVVMVLNVGLWALGMFDFNSFVYYIPGIIILRANRFFIAILGSIYCAVVTVFLFGVEQWPLYSALFAAALFMMISANALLHNASHNNFKWPWMSRAVGEFWSFFYLVGFSEWHVVHTLHHAHPDDPERDPHPPLNQSFVRFLDKVGFSIRRVLVDHYCEIWGANEGSYKALRIWGTLVMLSQYLKIAFWFMLLQPVAFGIFYSMTVVLKSFAYAHFNYYTHRPDQEEEGGTEILNLKQGLFFQSLNIISFGLYYHQNHHKNPNLFNPSQMKVAGEGVVESHPARSPELAVSGASSVQYNSKRESVG